MNACTPTSCPHPALATLRRQYYALLPARLVAVPPAAQLASSEAQRYLLEHVLGVGLGVGAGGVGGVSDTDDARALTPPTSANASGSTSALVFQPPLPQPEDGYRRAFWRRVVRELELGIASAQEADADEEAEIDDRFYELLAGLMAVPGSDTAEPLPSFRSFIYDIPAWSVSVSNTHIAPIVVSPRDREGASDTASNLESSRGRREAAVTLLEEQTVLQAGTTGLRTWTAALHLAAHILLHPELLCLKSAFGLSPSPQSVSGLHRGQETQPRGSSPARQQSRSHIIELGAGTGFLAVLLAQLGADVLATDLDLEDASGELGDDTLSGAPRDGQRQAPLGRLRHNVELNARVGSGSVRRGKVDVNSLDWFDAFKPAQERRGAWRALGAVCGRGPGEQRYAYRTIIAADVIYDPDLLPALVATIRELLTEPSAGPCPAVSLDFDDETGGLSQAIIAATVRNADTLALFEAHCAREGLDLAVLRLPPLDAMEPLFWDSGLDAGSEVRVMRITMRLDAQ